MRPVSLVLTIMDARGQENQMLINLVDQTIETSLANYETIAQAHQQDIDALTDGQIVRCGLVFDVDLHGSLKGAPVTGASNEAGALFVFVTDGGYATQFRIPAFNEDFLVASTPEVDLTETEISDLLDNIIDGYSNGSTLRAVVDSRGDDIVSLSSSKEIFQRGRV